MNRKTRITTRTEGRAAAARELSVAVRGVIVVGTALLLVLILDLFGLVAVIDDGLRRGWIELGEATETSRTTSEQVVLVAADHKTIEAWGPPPWPVERLEQLLAQIEPAGPRVVAEVGHTQMFEPGVAEQLDPREVPVLLGARSPWAAGGLERGDLAIGQDGRMHEIAREAGLGDELDRLAGRLPVHWLIPAGRLPVIEANMAALDDNLRSSYRGRIVLLGVTSPNYEMMVDTPLGRLSPAEVETHALVGLVDGVVWAEMPSGLTYLLCAGFAILLLWSFARLRGTYGAIIVVASTSAILVLDFACYQRGLIRIGSGHALLTLAGVGIAYWVQEALETFAGLRELRVRVLRDATGEGEPEIDDDGFWDDLAELGTEYAREIIGGAAHSSIVEREGWELRIRASSADLDAESRDHLANREGLELRRAPFRTPWLTLRAGWALELLPGGLQFGKRKSLIVPLDDAGELLGLWLIHVSEDVEVSHEEIETFESLGRQMAGSLVRRRERLALREQGKRIRLRDHVETIVGGLRLIRNEHRWALELLEQLPVRALIATAWGEIEFVDPRLEATLRRVCPDLFEGDPSELNLRFVLARLTDQSADEAQRLMRKVVADGVELELEPNLDNPGDDVWVLSRIQSKRGIDLPGFKPAVHEHILLMARSSAPAQTVRTRSGGLLRVLRGGSGES